MNEAHLKLGVSGATSSLLQLGGSAGLGVYRLEVAMNWTPTHWDVLSNARVIFGGEVEVSFAQGMHFPLGQLQAVYAVAFANAEQRTHAARVDLSTNLLPAQLEALERKRAGGQLNLHLKVRGVLLLSAGSTASPAKPSAEGFSDDLEYRLKASEWMEVLERWEYAKGFLLEVPMLAELDAVRAVKASKDVEKAISEMAEGRYRDAIATCRDALETAYGGDDKSLYPNLGYKVTGLSEADKKERFWLARRGLWAVAHAAKHRDDTTDAIEWDRRDARALILMLSALLEQDPPI